MLSRLIVVVMLVLLPLQWSAAHGHEFLDDMRDVSQQMPYGQSAAKMDWNHTQDPGGICPFHQLAHASAVGLDAPASVISSPGDDGWSAAAALLFEVDSPLAEIERPKWRLRNSVAATL